MGKPIKPFELKSSARRFPKGSKVIGAADPDRQMEISLRVRPKPGSGLDDNAMMAMGAQLPSQRQYVAREDFAATAGADPADIAKIDDFAHQHGLNVKSVHLESRTVKLTGSVTSFNAAFGVKLQRVKQGRTTYRMRKGSVTIPQELKDIVVGVHGLDNRPVAKPGVRQVKRVKRVKQAKRSAAAPRDATAIAGFAVADIAKLYGFPTGLTGDGQCIAIIELNVVDSSGAVAGAGYDASDLATYFRGVGMTTPPSVTSVSIDGGANLPGQYPDADREVTLDIEVAGAIAPGAKIAVYFAPNTTSGFIDAVKAAAHDAVRKPSVISISWGGPEDPVGAQQYLDGLSEAIRDAAAMGITVCIASGDNGSADMPSDWDGKPHADFPAGSPFALGCGGTKVTAAGAQIASEVVWNEGIQYGSGGGGVSNYFALPSYQNSANVPKSPTQFVGRGVPDLAGNADPLTGYEIFFNSDGGNTVVGGTSAVAPLMAGLVALMNEATTKKFGKTVGFINPLIYGANAQAVFRRIKDGNNDMYGQLNDLYSAVDGWSACSGLGVPNGASLLQLLST
jgi:kumamolisin